jgi:hypothetical protein
VAVLYAALALALAVFSGTAFAGGGNGSGNGSGGAAGNSGSAPGQVKQDAAPAPAQPAAPAQAKAGKKAEHAQRHSTPAAPTTNDNSTGVKPSSQTSKAGHDTTAPASSNKTKQYGNGKTAGQIATKAGYGDATLHGPGNSQPHKLAVCGTHEVDVHALKAKSGKCTSKQGVAAAQKTEQKPEQKKPEQTHPAQKPCVPSVVILKPESTTQQQSATAGTAAAGDNSKGVKPSNLTNVNPGHDTHAAASSDKTKLYGNGKTAGQIATQAGYGSAMLHGPGNSQPHKVLCGPHEVDVHALKAKAGKCGEQSHQAAVAGATCEQQQAVVTPQTSQPTPTAAPATESAQATQSAQSAPVASASAASSSPTAATQSAGGVKGATATLTKAKPASKAKGGVLGATAKIGSTVASTRLPFTGLPLWIFVAVAAALIAIGFTVRNSARDEV